MTHFITRLAAVGVSLLFTSTLVAQDLARYISVSGEGVAKAKPTSLMLTGVVSGSGDVTSDAVTKYLGAKRQAIEALEELKIDDMKIEGDGFSVAAPNTSNINPFVQQLQGRPNPKTAKVLVSEALKIRLSIKTLDEDEVLSAVMKILDAGQEANIQFAGVASPITDPFRRYAPQQFITFQLDNEKELKRKAHALAVKNAREEATELAKLTGLEITGVRSVDSSTSFVRTSSSLARTMAQGPTAMRDISVTAGVRMSFTVKTQ